MESEFGIFLDLEWSRSQNFARKPEQDPEVEFNLCLIPFM